MRNAANVQPLLIELKGRAQGAAAEHGWQVHPHPNLPPSRGKGRCSVWACAGWCCGTATGGRRMRSTTATGNAVTGNRLEYDIATVQAKVVAAGLPATLAQRLSM